MSDKEREKKLGEEFDAAFEKWQETEQSTPAKNARILDEVMARLTRRCQNPFCQQPIKSVRENDWSSPDYGDVCATCSDALRAFYVTNNQLKDYLYWRRLHEAWKKENEDAERKDKERRRRLGLDGDIGGSHGF